MKTYHFYYSISDVYTEQATWFSVRARNLRKATKAARRWLKRHVKANYPGHRGELQTPGQEVKPRKPWTPEQVKKHLEWYERVIAPMMAKVGPVILDVINRAPPI